MKLIAPSGAITDAADEFAAMLLANGFKKAEEPKEQKKAPRRTSKPKEE